MSLLPRQEIPKHLWNGSVIYLPVEFVNLYQNKLIQLGKLEEAKKPSPADKDLIGGVSREATIDHFTYRFPASAVRVEYVALDPDSKFQDITDDLLTTLSDGNIAVLDIPCGSGAGILSLLSTVADLRKNRTLPKLPLTITITAGDISETALEIYESLLSGLSPILLAEGIALRCSTTLWDATAANMTASIIDKWFTNAPDAEEYIGLFSHFLQ